MVIPIYLKPKFKVGDIIISLFDINLEYYRFTPYHEFTIISHNDEDGYTIKDNELGIELVVDSHYKKNPIHDLLKNFTIKTDLNTARKRSNYLNRKKNFIEFIRTNCPNLSYGYDEYERYETCKIKKGYCNSCNISEDCICHISSDAVNKNSDVIKYIRDKKLKKIKNI